MQLPMLETSFGALAPSPPAVAASLLSPPSVVQQVLLPCEQDLLFACLIVCSDTYRYCRSRGCCRQSIHAGVEGGGMYRDDIRDANAAAAAASPIIIPIHAPLSTPA